MQLDQLQPREPAVILAVEGRQDQVERLSAFGLRPGQMLQILRRAPWSGPFHVQVSGTEMLLRAALAQCVSVQRLNQA